METNDMWQVVKRKRNEKKEEVNDINESERDEEDSEKICRETEEIKKKWR
jgi:hypothetical protein